MSSKHQWSYGGSVANGRVIGEHKNDMLGRLGIIPRIRPPREVAT